MIGCRRFCARGHQTAARALARIASIGVLLFGIAGLPGVAPSAEKSTTIKIAVFDFELEDETPAASYLGETTSSAANLEKVSAEARRMLSESGRYNLIDVRKASARPVTEKSLRRCDGCEAGIAMQLGAEQSLIGVVTRVTQTDYYLTIQIRDARTSRILDQQQANFAGSDDGWASGVRMLIKHQILVN